MPPWKHTISRMKTQRHIWCDQDHIRAYLYHIWCDQDILLGIVIMDTAFLRNIFFDPKKIKNGVSKMEDLV